MEFEEWQKYMLAKGHPKPFLGNIAIGSINTFQSSIVKLAKADKNNYTPILEETLELKANAANFGLNTMIAITERMEQTIQENDHEKSMELIREMANCLKSFKAMIAENYASQPTEKANH